jgi:hypothetical protein
MIKFEERSTFGRGTYTAVKRLLKIGPAHSKYKKGAKNVLWVTVGRIDKSPLGYYQYFEPDTNELTPSFIADALEDLKAKVVSHLESKRKA